ncbi:MAG: YdcF family protein [Phycisphaerales bacterium]
MNLLPTRWYTMFFMPSFAGLALLAAGLLGLLWWSRGVGVPAWRRHAAVAMSVAGMLILYLASTPLVATWLTRSLERLTPHLRVSDAPPCDAIVVLGGGQQAYLADDGSMHVFTHHAGDRMEQGIQAYLAGKAPLLAVGGGAFELPGLPPVSNCMAEQARSRGIPAEAVIEGGPALYTVDESQGVARQLQQRGVRRVLLCTSAVHMPRARLLYERLGLEVVPLPCDFDTRGAGERFSPLLLVPRGLALAQTENALKEWIGLTLYRARLDP